MEQRPKVIQIITQLELGGAQEVALYLAAGLDKERYEVALITGSEGILVEEARRLKDVRLHFVPELVRAIDPRKDLRALRAIREILAGYVRSAPTPERGSHASRSSPLPPPGVLVHTHSSKAGILGRWAARQAGVPAILHTFHGYGFNDYQPPLKRQLFVALERWTGRISTRLVLVSRPNLEKGLALKLFRPEQAALIDYGIDLSRFARAQATPEQKAALGLGGGDPVVGMVSNFKPQKSPLDFVEMAHRVHQEVPEARFFVAGDGPLRPQAEQLIERYGLQDWVRLLGWRRDIPELLSLMDLFVLTSLWEGLPLVFLEAMAAGKPIVATQVDGATDVIHEGVNGFLCPPRDCAGLARRVIQLLRDPRRAAEMGRRGREGVQGFSQERMLAEYQQLYQALGGARDGR
ncbi:MAG: glycosyltransferase family 4 protein [Candidatus Tectomicrobia bacterium]|uniref:Glycosyltransferase family 4 protein n=1 Tax=Tectimicrobiota bacterium TaxID=2528274 RepID=A0A932CNE5_UNCTE|nr:glycosyltransferase family 4 protein [Candidatus Tectomicrobia bacterium]